MYKIKITFLKKKQKLEKYSNSVQFEFGHIIQLK